jgi:hypothetical protein
MQRINDFLAQELKAWCVEAIILIAVLLQPGQKSVQQKGYLLSTQPVARDLLNMLMVLECQGNGLCECFTIDSEEYAASGKDVLHYDMCGARGRDPAGRTTCKLH